MASSSLSAYLAKNYLTPDTPLKKSKKRKRTSTTTTIAGLSITNDDAEAQSWTQPKPHRNHHHQDSDDSDDFTTTTTTTTNIGSAEFRKKKSSQWQTLSGAPAIFANEQEASAARDADALLAQAARENAERLAAEDREENNNQGDEEDEEESGERGEALRMSNGAHAGLQSASAMAVQIARHKRAEQQLDLSASSASASGGGGGGGTKTGANNGETIYRDASGRVVNIAMKRAEARAAAAAKEARLKQEQENARGDVQRVQKEARKQELEDAKIMPFARGVDDEKVNAELRERLVWGDPMAGQLDDGDGGGKKKKKKGGEEGKIAVVKKSITGRPLYNGAAPPNRYGIRPGHKWDGVDRGTGFESEWFKARNQRKNREQLEWNWQMDE